MPQYTQVSMQLTDAELQQIADLSKKGFGNRTDVVRIAVDRMAKQEEHTVSIITRGAIYEEPMMGQDLKESSLTLVVQVADHPGWYTYTGSYDNELVEEARTRLKAMIPQIVGQAFDERMMYHARATTSLANRV